MPQQFLHRADIVAILQQVGSETVAKGVAGDALVDPGQASGFLDRFLHAALADVVTAHDAGARIF